MLAQQIYTIMKTRSKISKKGILRKRGDRDGDFRRVEEGIRCMFFAVAGLNDEGWILRIRNLALGESHPTLRKLRRTEQSIPHQSAISATIFVNLKPNDDSRTRI